LDATDLALVRLLLRDGRTSFADLARATRLSTSAVHQRVRRLEERGVLQGYRAVVDAAAIGLPLTAFVSLSPIDPADPDDIPERLQGIAEIEACYSVAGDHAYVLLVRVASPVALEDLIARIRAAAHCTTRTTVVLSIPFEHRPLGP
jgi:Lrp/AsnC family leucine-responsive transcriptional regulator